MVSPLMSQMEIGQTGYIHTNAITVINGDEVFININSGISETKRGGKYLIPIKRIGPGIEDFEIDFNVAYYFFNNNVSQEEREKLKKTNKFIGPYTIKSEIYRAGNYREQGYPRMDLDELMDALININQLLDEIPEHEVYTGDKKELRRLIKEKLNEMSAKELEYYIKSFSPLEEENSQNGEIINYLADESILKFIIERIKSIKTQQKLEDLPTEELKEKLKIANNNQNFELSAQIRDIINKKNNQ